MEALLVRQYGRILLVLPWLRLWLFKAALALYSMAFPATARKFK
jgi:hypothetical protein